MAWYHRGMPSRLRFYSHLGAPTERQTKYLTRPGLLLFFAGILRRPPVLAAAAVLGTTAGRAETAALAGTEIASGLFVRNGGHGEAPARNDEETANAGLSARQPAG